MKLEHRIIVTLALALFRTAPARAESVTFRRLAVVIPTSTNGWQDPVQSRLQCTIANLSPILGNVPGGYYPKRTISYSLDIRQANVEPNRASYSSVVPTPGVPTTGILRPFESMTFRLEGGKIPREIIVHVRDIEPNAPASLEANCAYWWGGMMSSYAFRPVESQVIDYSYYGYSGYYSDSKQ